MASARMRPHSLLFALLAPLLVAACATGTGTTPRIRVAQDLGCTAAQTGVRRLSEHRWEVSGCGRTAIYVCTAPVVRDCWREGAIHGPGTDVAPPPSPIADADAEAEAEAER